MELLELSREKLIETDRKLADLVLGDYNYDLVIFIARGSYGIGVDLAEANHTPLLEIFASRSGGGLKKILRPILRILPKSFRSFLRRKEVNSGVHEQKSDRKITFDEKRWKEHQAARRILLVDDSVDTGYSVLASRKAIAEFFPEAELRVAALNCFTKSESVVKTEYALFHDTMLSGPWSNDSRENQAYLKEYEAFHARV